MVFELSEKEVENYENFQLEMEKRYSVDERSGGFYQISFILTGIGYLIKVSTVYGDMRDITDYDLRFKSKNYE